MKEKEKFTKEWLVLEQCILLLGSKKGAGTIEELLPELDWGELLHQALRHNLLPLLAHTIRERGLTQKVPAALQEILYNTLAYNRHVLDTGYREVERISRAFEREGVAFVVTKGYVFDELLYDSLRIRKSNDIDIMAAPGDKAKATEIMQGLGYIVGYFDNDREELVEISEQGKKLYAMTAEYAPEFAIRVEDPIVKSICVDMGCSLTWFGSQYKVPIEEALKNRQMLDIPGCGGKMPCFDTEHQIIYTALHLFKEAWVEMYGIKDGNDVNLSKFMDMYRLLGKNPDSFQKDRLRSLVRGYNIVKPVLWVIKHTDRIFGCDFCGSLGFDEDISEAWLSSWQTRTYKLSYWKGSMRERLQSKNREELFIR